MNFDKLIKKIRKEKVTLFIGAGFSYEAGAPSVNDLCEALLADMDADEQTRTKLRGLSEVSEYYVEEYCNGSRNDLITLLRSKFQYTPKCLDDHKALAKIPHFRTIFTTNYDTLLEDSYPEKDVQVCRNDKDCTYIDDKKRACVFKLHGDFTDPDSVVITKTDYDNYFKHNTKPFMWDLVKTAFVKTHILFIGYSLEDENILDIIKNISESVNRNQKDMFLIAPGVDAIKRGKLRKMKVQYYDAYASDFLKELTNQLVNNISNDFRRKWITSETFTRFCSTHDVLPVTSESEERNQIVDVRPLKGKTLNNRLTMSVKKGAYDRFQNFDFEKDGVRIKESPYPNVPAFKLEGDDLLECKHYVNDIVLNDNIEQVLIAPAVKERKLTILIPSRGFIEQVTANTYNLPPHKFVVEFDCGIYKTCITISAEQQKDKGTKITTNFKFDFAPKYKDNNAAIRWIDFISAFFSKEDITIKEILPTPINARNAGVDIRHPFEVYKKYYENIKKIELLTGNKFSQYENFTDEAYRMSLLILSYKEHSCLSVPCEQPFNFSTRAIVASDDFHVGDTISIVTTEEAPETLSLNGTTFKVPYKYTIMEGCQVSKREKEDDGRSRLFFHYPNKEYRILLSDEMMEEEFPSLKRLELEEKVKVIEKNNNENIIDKEDIT